MNAVVFLYVPGKNWLMTSIIGTTDSELKAKAEEFIKAHGGDSWTEVRVYNDVKPHLTARRGTVVWGN